MPIEIDYWIPWNSSCQDVFNTNFAASFFKKRFLKPGIIKPAFLYTETLV
jgi:hypothetical protein